MKTKTSSLMKTWTALAALTLLGGVSNLHADPFSFDVDINTAGADLSAAPYSLDFYLIYGGTSTLSNIATISDLTFTGTGAGGTGAAPIVYSGNATGNFNSGFTLNTSTSDARDGSMAEIAQEFTPGTTDIKFKVTLTQNTTGIVPDTFQFSLDDNSTFPVVTSAPDGAGLIEVGIPSLTAFPPAPLSLAGIQTFSANGVTVSVSAAAVPEPSSWIMGLLVLLTAGFLSTRLRQV